MKKQLIKHLVSPSQAKTENTTYPWPDVSLVTLGEKQEKNNCQQLLPLYTLTGQDMQKSTTTAEQTGLKTDARVCEGSKSKVIFPKTS